MARSRGPVDVGAAGGVTTLEWGEDEQLVLSDLINRVLDKGIVISGHVTISVADIDLIALDLRLLITSIQTAIERPKPPSAAPAR
jgi:gas vesicle structural protein